MAARMAMFMVNLPEGCSRLAAGLGAVMPIRQTVRDEALHRAVGISVPPRVGCRPYRPRHAQLAPNASRRPLLLPPQGTQAAVRTMQHSMNATGQLDQDTLAAMNLGTRPNRAQQQPGSERYGSSSAPDYNSPPNDNPNPPNTNSTR